MKRKYKAISVNAFVTARETNNGQILLFTPRDYGDGCVLPSSEIFVTLQELKEIVAHFEPTEGGDQ